MQKHTKYFFWDNKYNLTDIKLGDDFKNLLAKGIVVKNKDRFVYHKDKHIWISESNGEVSTIYCTQGSGNHLIEIDLDKLGHSSMETVISEISKKLIEIKETNSPNEFKEFKSDKDLVIILFRDRILSNVLITRKN